MSVEAIQAVSMAEISVGTSKSEALTYALNGMDQFPDTQKLEQAIASSVQRAADPSSNAQTVNAASAIENSVFGKGLDNGPVKEIAAAIEAGVPMTTSFLMSSQLALMSFQANFSMCSTAGKELRKAKTELQSEGRQ